jgi:hypothetical protein
MVSEVERWIQESFGGRLGGVRTEPLPKDSSIFIRYVSEKGITRLTGEGG